MDNRESKISEAEIELWRTVIRQALQDVVSKGLNFRDRRASRRWFRMQPLDFLTVCDLANLDADKVRKRALKLMKKQK